MQIHLLNNKNKNQKSTTILPILGRINALWLPNRRYRKLLPNQELQNKRRIACPTSTPILSAISKMWTIAFDSNSLLTKPTIRSNITTYSLSDLALLIYSSFILYNLKSNSNIKLNDCKNILRKFYYPQLIIWFNTALFAHRTHINHFTQLFPLRFDFLNYNKI